MVLQANLSSKDVVVVVPNPDVLILMIYGYSWLTEDGFLETR